MTIDYDTVAAAYDRRYALHDYAGVRAAVLKALPAPHAAVLELGCGTGRWLTTLSSAGCSVAGIDPSRNMLDRAEQVVRADLRQGVAEMLPWSSETFDAVCCINALHHFAAPGVAIGEAARVLRPGGVFINVGLDPHVGRDRWWVYEFFHETRSLDLSRFPSGAQRLQWIEAAGLADATVEIAERLVSSMTFSEAVQSGVLDRSFTSQLTALTPAQHAAGMQRIRDMDHADANFRLVSDLSLYATIAKKPESTVRTGAG